MRPRIGIVGNQYIGDSEIFYHNHATYTFQGNVTAMTQAGGIPMIIPIQEPQLAASYLAGVDGLFLPGGQDVSPQLYGQQPHRLLKQTSLTRDRFELALFELARQQRKPILGICRGFQLINVALGGTLYQDVSLRGGSQAIAHDQAPEFLGNTATHWVTVHGELQKPLGERLFVNSLHHQVISKLAESLIEAATADDGVIEAAVEKDGYPLLAVQWHPEMMLDNAKMRALFTKYLAFF
ncbi:gamma-glutamyl-gamma-aminobutyrate hydrolase family protein [Pediococcus siamensis]|uniref:gamma-glutamyl-gamma-aminobutyrate hydrolase family protein n=1 Tax=Pediococcus siamensis TaxID=381829 RepID=UPI0039A36804